MLVQESDLYLYHLTLQRQSNYVNSCIGHFIDAEGSDKRSKDLQLCIATETHIEVYDVARGTLHRLAEIPIFATITTMESFRMENSNLSLLAMTSDSGNFTVARFHRASLDRIDLETLVNHPMTRSQIRRVSPISHMTLDPYGRCVLLSAIEKNKLCFVLNRNSDGTLAVQSPLEAIRPGVITLDITACDVQYDNPCFAAIEIEANAYHLVFYILDLGLNHIVKKADYQINSEANYVMGIPALSKYKISCATETDEINPFVLVGFDNYLLIKDLKGFFSLKVQIPRRSGQNVTIISGALQVLKKSFFILLQSNFGDLYKLTVEADENDRSRPLVAISYFDTISQAEKLHIFKNGYLYANSELGDSHLFQFESLGEDSEKLTSAEPENRLEIEPTKNLNNLSIVSNKKNLNPLLSTQVLNSNPLTIAANSTTFLTNGVNFETDISSPLPPGAENIWTIKVPGELTHKLLFLAFARSTMILQIENGTIEELKITNNPFNIEGDKLIYVAAVGNRSIIQVCGNELRQVISNQDGFTCNLKWFPPAGIRIISATSSETQLSLALSNNEIVYFEISSDSLHELQDRIEFDESISCISMVKSQRSDFLAVGTNDSTVKLISLKRSQMDEFMEIISMQTVLAPVTDVRLTLDRELELHVGLQNGVYCRSRINSHDGQLYDVRSKFLGPTPVTLSCLESTFIQNIEDEDVDEDEDEYEDEETKTESEEDRRPAKTANLKPCILLHCNKTWISYTKDTLLYIRPLLSGPSNLTKTCEFMAEKSSVNGCCAINSSGSLVIGKLKHFITHERWLQAEDVSHVDDDVEEQIHGESEEEEEEDDRNTSLKFSAFEKPKLLVFMEDKRLLLRVESSAREDRMRISLSRSEEFYHYQGSEIFKVIEGISVIAASLVKFTGGLDHLVVSTRDGKLKTFEVSINKKDKNYDVRLLHTTLVEDHVNCMIQFSDKLLAPVFGNLILFSLGKKQLLKQSISETTPSITKITSLANWKNERVAVGDIRESATLFLLDKSKNVFVPIADDVVKRHVTTLAFLDSSTILGGDKFGNLWSLRLGKEHEELISQCFPYAIERLKQHSSLKKNAPNIMECPFKLSLMNMFYVNDIPMNIHVLDSLQMSDRPAIIYSGLQGTIGCLSPLLSRAEITSFNSIQSMMSEADDRFFFKSENDVSSNSPPQEDLDLGLSDRIQNDIAEGSCSIVGRDHLKYRSYYAPVRNIIDGDLCERFMSLSSTEQRFLCSESKTLNPDMIVKNINDIRTNCI